MLPFSRTESHFSLIAAVTLFVALDLSVLGINYGIVWRVDQDAVSINLAGRQRMLTERIAKSLLILQDAGDDTAARSALDELADSTQMFAQTLAAFERGGPVTYTDGRIFPISPLTGERSQTLLAAAQRQWDELTPRILPVLNEARPPQRRSDPDLLTAIAAIQRDGPVLVDTMNRLTTHIEMRSMRNTRQLRLVQTLAFALALINFFVIMRMLRRRYQEAVQGFDAMRKLIDQIGAGVCLVDDRGEIIAANRAAGKLVGRNADSLRGKHFEHLLERDENAWVSHLPNGKVKALDLLYGDFSAPNVQGAVVTLLDVSSRYTERNLLRHLANHDPLTGLPNRRLLYDRMQQALAHARRYRGKIGVALIDLDDFKLINDRYGHAAGDAILRQVAERLSEAAREEDTLARVGGDEFVGLFPGPIETIELTNVTQRLRECFVAPFDASGSSIQVNASIGLAEYPANGDTIDALLQTADQAMYRVKHREET